MSAGPNCFISVSVVAKAPGYVKNVWWLEQPQPLSNDTRKKVIQNPASAGFFFRFIHTQGLLTAP